jgi:hypothetical protein
MHRALRNGLLCVAIAALGLVAAVGLTGSGSDSADRDAPGGPLSWTARVPVLSRIANPPDADVAPPSARSEQVAEADALVERASMDPAAAMRGAAALEDYWLRLDTLERIASVWARQAPADALSHINGSRDFGAAKRSIRMLVLEAWARADPVDALNFLSGAAGSDLFFTDQPTALQTASAIADSESYLLLTRADIRSPGFVRNQLRQAAINVIVERDPELAERQIALARSDAERAEWEWPLRQAEQRRLAADSATDRPD